MKRLLLMGGRKFASRFTRVYLYERQFDQRRGFHYWQRTAVYRRVIWLA